MHIILWRVAAVSMTNMAEVSKVLRTNMEFENRGAAMTLGPSKRGNIRSSMFTLRINELGFMV